MVGVALAEVDGGVVGMGVVLVELLDPDAWLEVVPNTVSTEEQNPSKLEISGYNDGAAVKTYSAQVKTGPSNPFPSQTVLL